jgi:hypothetical protein
VQYFLFFILFLSLFPFCHFILFYVIFFLTAINLLIVCSCEKRLLLVVDRYFGVQVWGTPWPLHTPVSSSHGIVSLDTLGTMCHLSLGGVEKHTDFFFFFFVCKNKK